VELEEENCKGTNFSNCNLEGARFVWCIFDENTKWEGACLYKCSFYLPQNADIEGFHVDY